MYVHLCDLCTSLRKVVLPLPLAPTHTVSVMLLLLFHCTVNVDGVVSSDEVFFLGRCHGVWCVSQSIHSRAQFSCSSQQDGARRQHQHGSKIAVVSLAIIRVRDDRVC